MDAAGTPILATVDRPTLDFGRGDEQWKYKFGATDRSLRWIALTAA
jgi:hypothetical protein